MRIKTNIVKLLAVLAILGSLVAMAAVPAGAISAYSITVTPTATGATAQYTVGPFTVAPGAGKFYLAGANTFTVTFPVGTTVPASIGKLAVTVTDNTNSQTGNPPVDALVSGLSVTVTVPAVTLGNVAFANIVNGDSVTIVFSQTAGIQNPATVASNWQLSVAGAFSGGGGGSEAAVLSNNYSTTAPTAVVSLSPTYGPRGTSFAVSGYNFTPGTVATVTVGTTILGYTSVGTDGRVSGTFVATNPPFSVGLNTITVKDGAGIPASATFTLKAGITVSPTSGRPGDTITITGTDTGGVAAGATTIGGVLTTHAVQAADWTSFTVVIPAGLAPGSAVVAVPDSNGIATASLLIQGSPVTITPATGTRGTQVTISGSGFTPSTLPTPITVTVTFGGTWATGSVDSAGNFIIVTQVGSAQQALGPGTWTVLATDTATPARTGSATFTIPARTLTLNPTSSGAGSSVVATGAGFSATAMYSISYGATVVVTGMTDGVGGFIAQFGVPITALPNITYTVTATDANSLTKTATHSVPAAGVTISPTSGPSGTSVTVTLLGFPAYLTAHVTINGNDFTPSPAPYTGASGSVVFNLIVPALPAGPVAIQVIAGSQTGSTFFTVTAGAATTSSALASISSQLVRVWGYSGGTWSFYDPADIAGSDLTTLTSTNGYWIDVNAACTLLYGSFNKALSTGWNLVGWP